MTVQKDIVKNTYAGNGSTTVFPITFEINQNRPDYVYVYLVDKGIPHLIKNYTLDLSAKTVTYPNSGEPLTADKKLVIMRELPILQDMVLINDGPFFAKDIEGKFDDVIMILQQLEERLGRTLSVSIGNDALTSLPPPEAGKAIGWNTEGTQLINIDHPEALYNATLQLKEQTEGYMQSTNELYKLTITLNQQVSNNADIVEDAKNTAIHAMEQAAKEADRSQSYASNVKIYSPSETYQPTDVVMMPNGATYRCIAESVGESPYDSSKWVPVSAVIFETFEYDSNGDLMPRIEARASTYFELDDNGDIMPAGII